MIRAMPSIVPFACATAAAACFVCCSAVRPAVAAPQTQPPGAISIEAEQGIEWQRQAKVVIARGNAKAVRDDRQIRADVLTAHYREGTDGAVKVWKIDAGGQVRLTSPGQSAYGERGTFNVDDGTLTLSGGKQIGVNTPSSRITAEKRIDYDVDTQTLVAYGNAVAVEGDRTLYGDVITVNFGEDRNSQSAPVRIAAEGRVRIVTPDEEIRADRGTYEVERGLAIVEGSVRLVRGANQVNGCRGEMNMRTGVSKLSACPGQQDGASRVQGVIIPNPVKNTR